jgi:DNA repair protein RadD
MRPLRDYQSDALDALRNSVRQGVRRIVLQAPTGSGKTRVAADIVQGAQAKGNRMVFVVPAISLIDQTVEMFWSEGIRDIGVIQANHALTDWSKPVQVASIQTIHSRGVYPEARVVVIDECHQLHKEHVKWLTHPEWQTVPFVGLSATPWTRGLGRYFESLLVMSTTKELIDAGYLAPFRVFASDHPDLSGVKTVAGDYHEGQLSGVMQDNALVANIIETYKDKWNKGKTFCFGVDCAHAKKLQERFQDAGISCAYQDATTSMKERAEIKRGFHNGAYQVVANVGTLTTGVDWDVRCLILARPTKSEMLFTQIIGRALRTAEGKDKALILDHTDTTLRLGFVTDIHHETLSSGKFGEGAAKRKPPLPKPCPSCACLIPVGTKACPACGFERKVAESKIYEREGQLVEFDGVFRKEGDRQSRTYTLSEKARFYAQLKGYGETKGYKPGWAANKYKDKFKAWPDWSIKNVVPMAPGPEVAQWIRFTQIQWAKSKRNQSAEGERFI